MLRGKAAIMAVIILTALIVAYHWRKGAGTVVVPVALLASYVALAARRLTRASRNAAQHGFHATERERMAVLINIYVSMRPSW